jgi:hypothetical protein
MIPVQPVRRSVPLALALVVCACNSPSPYDQKMAEVESAYRAGQYERAKVATAPVLEVGDGAYRPALGAFTPSTAALIDLEMAVLDLAAGQPVCAAARAELASRQFAAMLEAYKSDDFVAEVGKQVDSLIEPDLTRGLPSSQT